MVGSGGREHALALALAADPAVTELHAAPGNPGIAAVATLHAVDPMDAPAVAAVATDLDVDLVVVGPEAPLVAGVADAVRAGGVACFGPSREAAQLAAMSLKAAEIHDEQARLMMQRLVALAVPIITIVMGLAVAGIVSALLTAMLSLNELAM